ncbi:hypothetical protein DC094_11050 [Pelagibaculum spongiae]|uniref:Uncharacterized protein n=1 Tax=Pelagibaculum spongiae TaxID=2080658 RepID=A0A2V1GVW0_9GAMM|nr:hypothetical protein DC094_11050 [Pelagibaculum spongiae]
MTILKNSKKKMVQGAILLASSALMLSCGGGGSSAARSAEDGDDENNISLMPLTGDRWQADSYLAPNRDVDTTSRDGLWVMLGDDHQTLEDNDEFEEGDFERRMVFSVRSIDGEQQIRLCDGAFNGWRPLGDAGDLSFADVDTDSSTQYSFIYIDQQGDETEAITRTMKVNHTSIFADGETATRTVDGEYFAYKISDATSANLGQIDAFASHLSTESASIAVVPYLNKQIQIACLNEEKGPVLVVGEASENPFAQLVKKGIDNIDHAKSLLVAWDSSTGSSGSASFTEAFVAENSPSSDNGFITLIANEGAFGVWVSGADNSNYRYSNNVASQTQMEFDAEYMFLLEEKVQASGELQLDF